MDVDTPAPASPGATAAAPAAPGADFRPDIDALRAAAIVLVVLYHAHVPGFDGGFVGVDVFFAISGYLITRNLLAEHGRTARIGLRDFWARRLRRLAPAMAVTVAVSVLAAMAVLPPLRWGEIADQGRAAALYVSNLHFADLSDDYFAVDTTTAPLLHTWSLAVEQQFYLVWPVLVAGALAWSRRRRTRLAHAPLAGVLGIVAVASFALSVHLVSQGDSLAFYGLPARAWEFAAAGLLAIATARTRTVRPAVGVAVAVLGALAIAVPATAYSATTEFPGVAALPPVLGALALLWVGAVSRATWGLAVRPVRWIGRVSYSWYLWHWPAMIVAVAALDRDEPSVRVAAGALSVLIAAASLRFLEDPVRRSPRIARSGWATVAMAVGFTALALGASTFVAVRQDQVQAGNFHGPIAEAAAKEYLVDCRWDGDDHMIRTCELGDPDGDQTVLVSGDSHAMSWAPGFHLAGQELGVRILVRTANSCPGVPVATISEFTGDVNASCVEYREETRRIIEREQPDLVVLVSSDFTRRLMGPDGTRITDRSAQLATWAQGIEDLRDDLAASGIPLAGVLDNPRIAPDPLLCMEEERNLTTCGKDRATALERVDLHVRNEREAFGPEHVLETISMVCDDQRCHIYRDGVYVFADATHLSAPFTRAHADDVADFLRAQGIGA